MPALVGMRPSDAVAVSVGVDSRCAGDPDLPPRRGGLLPLVSMCQRTPSRAAAHGRNSPFRPTSFSSTLMLSAPGAAVSLVGSSSLV